MKIRPLLLFCCLAIPCHLYAKQPPKPKDPWSASLTLEAKQQYQQAIDTLQPLLSTQQAEFVLLRQSWLLYLQGHYRQSISRYQQALKKNTHSLDARLGITLPLLAQKRWREAAKYSQQILQVSPWHYLAHIRLMLAEEGQEQWQTLAAHAEALAARYPSEATPLVYQARAAIWQGHTEQATNIYRQVLIRVPGHLEALHYLRPQ
jgi:tetratricopeptide (TPR) repeat protein